MKQITDEQLEIVKEAIHKATHKEFENCSATVCEKLQEALKVLNNLPSVV